MAELCGGKTGFTDCNLLIVVPLPVCLGAVLFPGHDQVQQWELIVRVLGMPDEDFLQTLPSTIRRFITGRVPIERIPFERIFADDAFPDDSTDHVMLNKSNARDLLQQMLVIDPQKRITVDQALRHDYFRVRFFLGDFLWVLMFCAFLFFVCSPGTRSRILATGRARKRKCTTRSWTK